MLPEAISPDLIRSQTDRILASEGFVRNDRLSAFLRFVVEQELAGSGDQLKESVIGIEVFGRRPDYDVRRDSVVRTEAAKLRARLAEYYDATGNGDPLVVQLPKGGYRPVFQLISTGDTSAAALPAPARHRIPRWAWIAAVVAVSLAAIGLLQSRIRKAPISIAVLPLTNLAQDSSGEYFADGLTDEIIRNLSIIEGLAVRSQTSSFAFKGKAVNVRDAARQLDAEYILEGSVLRSGDHLRVNAQLVRVRDDFPLWSGRYDRESNDVFAIQDEISRGIVNSLRLELGRGRRRYETSTEAYDLYLHARAIGARSLAQDTIQQLQGYQDVIVKDPSFAPAYSGLAAVYAMRSGFDRFDPVERADLVAKMRAAADKAVRLDPLLAEAHGALAIAYARDGQWERSRQAFQHALELDPGNSWLRVQYIGGLLMPLFRLEEAVEQGRLAVKSDPLSASVRQSFSMALSSAGRQKEADALCTPPCSNILLRHGDAEAIRTLEERFQGDFTVAGAVALGRAYAIAGRREDAEKVAAIQWRPVEQAGIFMALGDKDRALQALERGIPLGPVRLGRDLAYAEFIPLRGDPRFKAIRRQLGLPDYPR